MTFVLANTTAISNVSNFPFLIWYMITAPPFILPTKPTYPEIYAVSGEKVRLPCDTSLSKTGDRVRLVQWFQGESKTPFKTVDARTASLEAAKYFCYPEECTPRIRFDSRGKPSALLLDPVLSTDDGLYRCRIEFEKSPTVNNMIRLHVITPPNSLSILDDSGSNASGLIGPYNEGHDLTLTCLAVGGKPTPLVTWWKDSMLIDDSQSTFGEETVNQFNQRLKREDQYLKLTCLATNTNLTMPLSYGVVVDMNLKPLYVNVTTAHMSLYAGWQTELSCESKGSRPPASITWWLEGERVRSRNETVTGDVTSSSLLFTPEIRDNGKTLTCRAENLLIPDSGLEHDWKIDVFYLPKLNLRFGANLQAERILEGTDIYFDCEVDANPSVPEIVWFLGRQPLFSNVSAGVIVSNQSLALRKLQRHQSGFYQCSATNVVGQGWSEPLELKVKYRPNCVDTNVQLVFLPLDETTTLECNIEANPKVETFHWKIDSGTWSTHSKVNYISYSSSHGYGDVVCRGDNEIGLQIEPCKFKIIKKDARTLLKDCGISRNADVSMEVSCREVAGLRPNLSFHLEVYSSPSNVLLANISSTRHPTFHVQGIPLLSEMHLRVYASGPEGTSEAVMFLAGMTSSSNASEFQIKSSQRSSSLAMTSLLIIVIAVFVLLLVIGCFVAIATRYYLRAKNKRRSQTAGDKTEDSSSKGLDEENSGCPDVVPEARQMRDSVRKNPTRRESIELRERSTEEDAEYGKVVFV